MLPSALFGTFHNNNNKHHLQIHITQSTELAAWRNRKQFKETRSPCLRKHNPSRGSLIWGRKSSEALGLRDIDGRPGLTRRQFLEERSPLGPLRGRQAYGKGAHPAALPWLAAWTEEELESSMAVWRLLLLLSFSAPEFSKALQLPRHRGLARKSSSMLFLLSSSCQSVLPAICPFHFHHDLSPSCLPSKQPMFY